LISHVRAIASSGTDNLARTHCHRSKRVLQVLIGLLLSGRDSQGHFHPFDRHLRLAGIQNTYSFVSFIDEAAQSLRFHRSRRVDTMVILPYQGRIVYSVNEWWW